VINFKDLMKKMTHQLMIQNNSNNKISQNNYSQYVFVISLHKTGTRSVDQLLKLLGYKTIHWPHTIDNINLEKIISGKEDNIEFVWDVLKQHTNQYNAFSDVPYSVLFKEAYRDYPKARFIYIYRDYSKWISSVRQHFGNKQFKGFNKVQYASYIPLDKLNTFTDLSDWDLISIFANHFRDVVTFFEDKQDQLGIFNLNNPNLGYDICQFLGFPPVFDIPIIKGGYHPVMNNFSILNIQKPKEVEEICRKSLMIAPENPYFYALYSLALAKRGKLEEAFATCEKAIQLNPSENLFRRIRIIIATLKLDVFNLWFFLKEYQSLSGGNRQLTKKVLSSLRDVWKRK